MESVVHGPTCCELPSFTDDAGFLAQVARKHDYDLNINLLRAHKKRHVNDQGSSSISSSSDSLKFCGSDSGTPASSIDSVTVKY
ncbi:hypothetical protein LIPSTDRAFT_104354 [Lipomyces starkeyi NRRL Y-11557]|uniref:Uncharacterized protein n=1 Tax=Lipomyces starkeyi NRRL Y-11557 TaxID=675824 RepID=A0A1E3Q9J3_LIPST|nr:hypothetical protein LIPSTDRAFT_104354 [Lipomyces starkeyi NRRL Y-11557]